MGLAQGRVMDANLVQPLPASEDIILIIGVGLFGGRIVTSAPWPDILGERLAARPWVGRERGRTGYQDGPDTNFLKKRHLHGSCSRQSAAPAARLEISAGYRAEHSAPKID